MTSTFEILPLQRNTVIPNADYIFEKYKEYEKMLPYFSYPKIGKRWSVILINFPIRHVREIIKDHSELVDFTLYLKNDVLESIQAEFPQLFKEELSGYDLFRQQLIAMEVLLDRDASRELYKRSKGNLEKVQEVLKAIKEEFPEAKSITKKMITSQISDENIVYARDVVLSLFLQNEVNLPSRGTYLSAYRHSNWRVKLEKLLEAIDTRVAFFAIRKYINELYSRKMEYLTTTNREIKDIRALSYISIMELNYAKILFLEANPKQLHSLLLIIEGRLNNACIISSTSYIDRN